MKNKSLYIVLISLIVIVFAVIVFNSSNSSLNGGKILIVGATWDIPNGRVSGIDFSNANDLQNNIDSAAESLADGTNLIVAGLEDGPISVDTYQAIVYRADQINSNHKGSITRIGGKNRNETKKLIDDYLNKH